MSVSRPVLVRNRSAIMLRMTRIGVAISTAADNHFLFHTWIAEKAAAAKTEEKKSDTTSTLRSKAEPTIHGKAIAVMTEMMNAQRYDRPCGG